MKTESLTAILHFAQSNPPAQGADGISELLVTIVNVLSAAVGVVVVLSLVIAGIQYITSSGNPQAVETAKNRIMASVISFIIYIFGFALLQWLIPGGIFNG